MSASSIHAKTPKGKARLQAIMDATFHIIVADGLAAASQEAIAQRAQVTQSAVRHYFPTKQALLRAFFIEAIHRVEQGFERQPATTNSDSQVELLRCVRLHFDAILGVDRIFFFEASAYWCRDGELSAIRKDWHARLLTHYGDLLTAMHPAWSANRIQDTALQILTLTQGCWLTLDIHEPNAIRRGAILDGIARLAGCSEISTQGFEKLKPRV